MLQRAHVYLLGHAFPVVAVAAFRGLRFDVAVVGDLGDVIAPPWDIVTGRLPGASAARSPYNVVHLSLTTQAQNSSDQYKDAEMASSGALFCSWLRDGVLRLEESAALYVYEETAEVHGKPLRQLGVLASVRLEETNTGILPHEATLPSALDDRLDVLAATATNLSPVFGVCADGAQRGRRNELLAEMTREQPSLSALDDHGFGHRLWIVRDQGLITQWTAALKDCPVVIADGHHRHQAALAYRDQRRAQSPLAPDGPWDETLMYLVEAPDGATTDFAQHLLPDGSFNLPDGSFEPEGPGSQPESGAHAGQSAVDASAAPAADARQQETLSAPAEDAVHPAEGPVLLAVHRILHDITPETLLEAIEPYVELLGDDSSTTPESIAQCVRTTGPHLFVLGLLLPSRRVLATAPAPAIRRALHLPAGALDVEVLHALLLQRLGIDVHDPRLLYRSDLEVFLTQPANGGLACLLRPPSLDSLLARVRGGGILPPKATLFAPKPYDGLVLRPLAAPPGCDSPYVTTNPRS